MGNRFKLSWNVTKVDEGMPLKEFVKVRDISRTALTDIKFKGGALYVNREAVTVRYVLKEGDLIEAYFPPEEPSVGIKSESFSLAILYEDQYFLVINKPSGMSTIPSREHPTGSLANGLIGYYRNCGIKATCHIVTRLDRDTTGIILVAKHRHVHHLMSKQQKAGELHRVYEALAEGPFSENSGIIDEPIGRKSSSIIEREVRPDGKHACTFFQVISQLGDFSHLELRLKTGRTHQIRVHLSFLKHPLLGDDLYGGKVDQIGRQALHCKEIQFFHPFLLKEMNFIAPLPSDMKNILNRSKPLWGSSPH